MSSSKWRRSPSHDKCSRRYCAALVDIGGLDNSFGPGAPFNCEDGDACTRASFAGWWGEYAPGPTVLHAHGRKAAGAVILRRSYDIGGGAYAAKFILQRNTRWFFARRWCAYFVNNLRRSGGPRECLSQIEGAIRFCSITNQSRSAARQDPHIHRT
jgi:hypothetical protein